MGANHVIAPSVEGRFLKTRGAELDAMCSATSQLLLTSAGNYKWKNVLHSVQRWLPGIQASSLFLKVWPLQTT